MVVFLKNEYSPLAPLYPYLEASGSFILADKKEDRIPTTECWIDACFNIFDSRCQRPDALHRLFAEIHSVLDRWTLRTVRLILNYPLSTNLPEMKRLLLLAESFSLFFEKAYNVLPLVLPLLLEDEGPHPLLDLIHAAKTKEALSLLWTKDSFFYLTRARECAEILMGDLPKKPLHLLGRKCSLTEIEEKTRLLWGGMNPIYEGAYQLETLSPETLSLEIQEDSLESMLMSLL